MDLDTFAAARDEDLRDLSAEYVPAVNSALQEPTEEDMTAEFVAALTVLFLLTYGEEGGSEANAQFYLGLFIDAMSAVLPETESTYQQEYDDEEAAVAAQEAQVALISNWFATATLGASTLYAAESNGSTQTKTWVTMRDEAVRETHAILEGNTQPIDGFFEVKTEPPVDMQYPGQPVGPVEAWINCRCVLAIGNLVAAAAYDVAMAVAEERIEDEELDGTEPPVPDTPLPGEDENQPVYGVAVPEGVESGDKRMFTPGGVTHRDLPLPLTYQRAAAPEHEGEVVVGRIDTLDLRDDGMWHYTGELLTSVPETEEVIDLIAQAALRGVSIAGDKGKVSQPTEEEMMAALEAGEEPVTEFEEARISGLTIVQIPAFQESFISLGTDPDLAEINPPMAASAEVQSFKRGSGWITHPEETKTLHNYWTKGEGAAKIRWGTGGDFTRCTRQLRKYIEPRFLNRTCAEWHHDALGYWPGELGKPGNNPKSSVASGLALFLNLPVTASQRSLPAKDASGRSLEERPVQGQIMSVVADAASAPPPAQVLRTGDRLQVFGVAAGPIAAEVVQIKTFGDGADITFVGEAVGIAALPSPVTAHVKRMGPNVTAGSAVLHPAIIEQSVGADRSSSAANPVVVTLADASPITWSVAAITKADVDAMHTRDATTKHTNPKTALECIDCEDTAMIAASAAPALTLTAAAPPATVSRAWFNDPKFSEPTALVVEKSGQVYGHIAKWGSCHIGIEGQCVTPPSSPTDYAHFHLGSVETDEGVISAGSLTLGTGHADLHLSGNETVRHYDHTGTMVASVRAGEDEHGIWIAGSLCEGVTDDQRRTLMAAGGISGDWRNIGGALELVAGLAVNVPGFPVPRPALAASGAMQESLVAAGVVLHKEDPTIDAIATAVVAKIAANEKRAERLAALAPVTASVRERRVAKLAAITE